MSRKIFLIFFISQFFIFCENIQFKSKIEFSLGTIFEIKIEDIKNSEEILTSAFNLVKNLEEKFSIFKENSEISRLNKLKKINASEETVELIKKAIYISRITGGAFDITCKPVIDLYKRKLKENKLPSKEEIKEVLKKVGWKRIKIKGREIEIGKNMEIDLGGIAKGYIIDKVSEFLKSKGVKNGLVNGGGDIYCWGLNQNRKKWEIGIRNPFKKDKIIGTFKITEKGIATSGNYERYIKIKEKKIGHIVNPATGMPAENLCVSVTVIAPDCTTADGIATGIFVLGPEKGIELSQKIKEIEILIIDKNKKIYKTSQFPLTPLFIN